MKITRRSFVKKSSYSAAAVTVLGAGVALADPGSGKKNEILQIDVTATVDMDETWPGTGATRAEAIAAATIAVQQFVAGHTTTTIEDTKGDVDIDHRLLSITSSAVPPKENGAVISTVFSFRVPSPGTGYYAQVNMKIKAGESTRQTFNWGP